MKKTLVALMAMPMAIAFAQDSISIDPCLPGDALSPWADAAGPFGSEQRNAYVVTLSPFRSSWNTQFGMAPIMKSSRTNIAFFNSLVSSQGISRTQRVGVPFAPSLDTNGDGRPDRPVFQTWNGPGFGINNDPSVNRAPATVDRSRTIGNQFGVAFSEFSTTDTGQSYNAIISGLVNVNPGDPTRLHIQRVVAAINGCDPSANLSQFGFGGVDFNGTVAYRADDFNVINSCGVNRLVEDNLFRTSITNRNGNVLNVVSNDYPGGLFDSPTTDWLVRGSTTTHNTPSLIPLAGTNLLIGTNFDRNFVRGTAFGSVTVDRTHLDSGAGVTDHRGNISYTNNTFSFLGGGVATLAILGRDSAGADVFLNAFSVNNTGAVLGRQAFRLPAVVTDNSTGFNNLAGNNEFNNFASQVAFRGGNGQIAVGRDQAGNFMMAAQVDHPTQGNTEPKNYIAVMRRDGNGTVRWTMAGYNDGVGGKPILNGPGGTAIGQMVPLSSVFPNGPLGPSVSSPAFDAAGNVYFLSAVEIFGDANPFRVGLIRAVYNPTNFSYELELLAKVGDIVLGADSNTRYRISNFQIADSNSIDSATLYSGNVAENAHMSINNSRLSPRDPRNLGGLVIGARVVYDVDGDGDFFSCENGGPADQGYSVLLYIGAVNKVPVNTTGRRERVDRVERP